MGRFLCRPLFAGFRAVSVFSERSSSFPFLSECGSFPSSLSETTYIFVVVFFVFEKQDFMPERFFWLIILFLHFYYYFFVG